jgi:hypothetical protein
LTQPCRLFAVVGIGRALLSLLCAPTANYYFDTVMSLPIHAKSAWWLARPLPSYRALRGRHLPL